MNRITDGVRIVPGGRVQAEHLSGMNATQSGNGHCLGRAVSIDQLEMNGACPTVFRRRIEEAVIFP